jgi:hypothetical protein
LTKAVCNRSITFATPAFDEDMDKIMSKRKWGTREVVMQEHDHVRHKAGAVIDLTKLPAGVADELMKNKLVRPYVPELDDEPEDEAERREAARGSEGDESNVNR